MTTMKLSPADFKDKLTQLCDGLMKHDSVIAARAIDVNVNKQQATIVAEVVVQHGGMLLKQQETMVVWYSPSEGYVYG